VPRSTIRPCSITMIWSARRMVESRLCDHERGPTLHSSKERPCWIICSDSESRLEVASSRIRMRGSARMARANRDTLALAAGQLDASLSNDRVVFVGERFGELVDAGDTAGTH